MSVRYITEGSEDSPPLVSGEQGAMVLRSRKPSRSGTDAQTVDRWEGPIETAREMYDDYFSNGLVSSIALDQKDAMGTINLTWDVSFNDGAEPEPEPDDPAAIEDGWNVELIEVPTPLAAHPYFQAAYGGGADDIIEDEIARAESAIKRGREYIASGIFAEWVSRYYGLRMAGVEEWVQYGVEVSHTYTTDNDLVAQDTFINVGSVIPAAGIGMPAAVLAAVDKLEKISDYNGGSDPTDVNLIAAQFEYVKRPPSLGYTRGQNGNAYNITETWWGLAQWSVVVYPGGTWDPKGNTA